MKVKKGILISLILSIVIIPIIPIFINSGVIIAEKEIGEESIQPRTSSFSGGGYIMDTNADFAWVDISTTGTQMLIISDADNSYESISFTTWNFTFYETEYDVIYVSSNGWMSFTDSSPSNSWGDIPDPNNLDCIALFWCDLLTSSGFGGGGDVYYEFLTVPVNCLVIEYKDVWNDDNPPEFVGSFEVLLYENGTILFQYLNIQNFEYDVPVIGLDHGDGANFNSFDEFEEGDLPLSSEAISFNFNEMINYTLNPNENDEFTWIVSSVDHSTLNDKLGSNWEALFGLPSNMDDLDKTKVNVTSVVEDSTTLKINYSLWNWISYENSFSTSPSSYDNLTYLKNPKDCVSDYNLTNIVPLFVPNPAFGYLSFCDLDWDYDLDYETEVLLSLEWDLEFGDDELGVEALYNDKGILTDLEIWWWEYDPSFGGSIGNPVFQMFSFYETGAKPNYVGVNETDVLAYGVYYCKKYFPNMMPPPPGEIPDKYEFTIEFIGGEDPYLERVAVILSINADIAPVGAMPFNMVIFIYGNLEKPTGDQLLFSSTLIVANTTDWTLLSEKLDKEFNIFITMMEFTPLSNGFIMEYVISFLDGIKYEYIYTPNGVLQYQNCYNEDGDLYLTMRLNDFDYKIECPEDEDEAKLIILGADVALIYISMLISIFGLIWYYRRKK